jgi:hypothetical protein
VQSPYSAVANAAGTATITVTPRGSGGWRITQVSPEMLAGTAASVSGSASCAVRVNGFLVAPAVPQGDAVAGDPPIELQSGDVMTVVWTGCLPGNICQALVFWELLT